MPGSEGLKDRDRKVRNLLLNYPLLLMVSLESVFAELAANLGEAVAAGGAAMARSLTGDATSDPDEPTKGTAEAEVSPEIKAEVRKMFAEVRAKMQSDYSEDGRRFRGFIANPAFDEGVEIVDRHDLGLPRLTDRLADEDMARYALMLGAQNPELMSMLRELSEWQEKVPPFKTDKP